MPESITSDTTVSRTDDKVKYTNTRSQIFGEEDYLQVYNDTVQNLTAIRNKLQELENSIEETLDENSDELGQLHTLIEGEMFKGDVELEEDGITSDSLDVYNDLQQKKQQREQMMQQKNQILDQLDAMKDVAESIAEETGEEIKEYEE